MVDMFVSSLRANMADYTSRYVRKTFHALTFDSGL